MEKYNKHIAGNDQVEMIHVSLDSDKSPAETWAAKEQFPWLTILPSKVKKSGMNDYKTTRSVPEYHLVDKDGNTVAKGSSAIFRKIAEMKGS